MMLLRCFPCYSWLLLVANLSFAKTIHANSNIALSWCEGQVAVTKISGGLYLEGLEKFEVLIRLANDLLIAKKKHNIVHLEFSPVNQSQLLLGYDSFDVTGPYPNQRKTGISINFSGPMVNHREILNLLDWALDNEATIKSTQSAFQFRRFGSDNSTRYSVSQAMIHKARRSTSEIVSNILRKRIYRNELGKSPLEIEYFFKMIVYISQKKPIHQNTQFLPSQCSSIFLEI